MHQLNLLEVKTEVLPAYVLDAIAWASAKNGEVVIMVNPNKQGAATWLRQNLAIKQVAYQPETNQTAVKAIAPKWWQDLKLKRWTGGSGSSHPINHINW
ncbi:MAG: hypothetical protein ACK5WL_23225 [Pseudanabaena sp.]|jgi:hypothetical protein